MNTHQDWEGLAAMRRQELEREIRQLRQSALAPGSPSRWQMWMGRGIARVGRLLMRWGEQVAQAEPRQQTSLARQ